MARTLYPASPAYGAGGSGSGLLSAAGAVVAVFLDQALTLPADLALSAAGPSIGSSFTVGLGSTSPDLYGPDGVTAPLWVAGEFGAVAIYPYVGGLAALKSANLSDLASASAARGNLGLGSAATQPASAFDPSGAAASVSAASIAAVPLSAFAAKGDLLIGTGAGAGARLPVGADGTSPVADSTQATGLKWGQAFNAGSTYVFTGGDTFTVTAPTVVPLTVLGVAAQSGDLFENKNSAGTVLSAFSAAGALVFPQANGLTVSATPYSTTGSLNVSGVLQVAGQNGILFSGANAGAIHGNAWSTGNGTNPGTYGSGAIAQLRVAGGYRASTSLVAGDVNGDSATPTATVEATSMAAGTTVVAARGSRVATAVTNASLTSNVATLTTSASHGYSVGRRVVVSGLAAPYSGTFLITSVPSSTTFTYAVTNADIVSAAVAGGARSSIQTGPFLRVLDSADTQLLQVDAAGALTQTLATPGTIGQVTTLAAAHTGDAQQVLNSAGAAVFKVGSGGAVTAAGGGAFSAQSLALTAQSTGPATTTFQVVNTGGTVFTVGAQAILNVELRAATYNPSRFTTTNQYAGTGNLSGAALQLAGPSSGSTDVLQVTDNAVVTLLTKIRANGEYESAVVPLSASDAGGGKGGIVLRSPDGTRYRYTAPNGGGALVGIAA